MSSLLTAFATVGIGSMTKLTSGQLASTARVVRNMRGAGYSDAETTLMLKALYIGATRLDVREVWHDEMRGVERVVCRS